MKKLMYFLANMRGEESNTYEGKLSSTDQDVSSHTCILRITSMYGYATFARSFVNGSMASESYEE